MDPVPRSGCAMAAADKSTQQMATAARQIRKFHSALRWRRRLSIT